MRKKGVRFNNQDTSNGIRCKRSGSETAEITGGVMMGHPSCFNTDSNKISQLIFTVKNEITTATDCQQKWVGMFAVWRQPCDPFYQMTLRCFIPMQNVFTVENNFMTSCIQYVHLIWHILWHYSAWVQLKTYIHNCCHRSGDQKSFNTMWWDNRYTIDYDVAYAYK